MTIQELNKLRPTNLNNKIRIGSNCDGGYVLYSGILENIDVLVTYGVGWDIDFEEHFNKLYNKRVLMFDPTMFGRTLLDGKKLINYVGKFQLFTAVQYIFNIYQVWIDKKKLEKRNVFFINEGISNEKSFKYDTFQAHKQKYNLDDAKILLKIDIEGGEYDIFNEAFFDELGNVSQIVIEFHFIKDRFSQFINIIEMLLVSFELIHIHGNNISGYFEVNCTDLEGDKSLMIIPNVMEMTFVKRNDINDSEFDCKHIDYPIKGLDFPNNPNEDDIELNFLNKF